MSTHGGGLSKCGEIMNKFSGKSIRLIIVALVAGLLTPVTAAVSVDNITKTFTVRAADNSLLANAKVQVKYYNPNGSITRATAATTNSSGVAPVTVPKDAGELTYDIIPAAGDVTNAATEGYLNSSADENVAIKLELANFVLEVKSATGGTPPSGAVVLYPTGDGSSNSYIVPIRTGAFGIKIATNLNSTKVYQIRLLQYVSEYAAGQFSYSYGLKGAGTSGSQTYSVYTDMSATTVLSPTSNVYVLQYDAANISGTIKKADGTALILPNGSDTAFVGVRPVATSWPTEAASNFPITATGSQLQWYGRSRGTPGKYVIAATFPGQLTIPSFYIEPWKNSSNGFGATESGPFTTAPHVVDFKLPARGVNFAMKYVVEGTTTPADYSWSIYTDEVVSGQTISSFKMGASGGVNGQSALSLADGTYKFQIDTYDSQSSQSFIYSIVVSGGVSSLKNVSGAVVTKPSDGVYVLTSTPPNLRIKAVSAANNSTAIQYAYVELFNGADGTGEFVGGRSTGTTTADATLPDGTYMVRISGGNDWANYGNVEKVVTVSGGVATIAGLTKDSNGVYTIALPVKNFKFTLLDPSPATSAMLGWINYCSLDSSNNQTACWGEGVNSSGEGGAVLKNSTNYNVYVFPPSSSAYSRSTYRAAVNASGVVTLTPSEVANSRFVLRPNTANVAGTLVTVSGGVESNLAFDTTLKQGVDIQVQKKDVNGNFNWYGMSTYRNTHTWSFNFTEAGTYRILANPQGFTNYAWSYSSEFYVIDVSGTMKFSTISATDASPKTSLTNADALKIIVRTANLKLRTINPQTNELMKYGWAALFKKETDRETWVMNADLNPNNPGISGAYLADGNYRLELNPMYNGSNIAGLTKKNYDVAVNSGIAVVSYKGTNISAVDGRVTVSPSSSNITAKIVDASGTALKPGNNQWVSVNLQKLNTTTNNYDWTSTWANTDKDGFISMTVTEAGKYRLRIEPNGYGSSSITTTEPFIVEAGSESTFNKAFGDIALTAPSLRVKVTLPNSVTPINHIGVEIRKNNNWLDWSGTGPTGVANIAFSEEGTYQIVVHPQQEQLNAGATRKSYDVTVTKNSAGAFVAVVAGITAADGIYSVPLGSGNVAGSVYTPANGSTTGVANAQVVAIDTVTGQEMWEYSSNTTATGKFTMNLPNGVYKIMARAPWGTNTYGASDQIGTVTVTSNAVAVANGFAGLTGTTLVVQLKDPTWKGTVRTPSDVTDAVVPFAQVCLWNDNRWDCTTANEQGQWSLSAPTGFTTFSAGAAFEIADVRNRVYPNIRVNGAADVLAMIGSGGTNVPSGANTTTSQTLVNRFSSANVKITVTAGGVVQPNVWVTLDRPNVGWLGGNSTNAQGVASFFVADTTLPINARVEFNGNQTLTGRYAPTMIEFSGADVVASKGSGSVASLSVALLTPNFTGVVTQTSTNLAPVQWSWIELFDDATNQWKGGSNTEANGQFAMSITRPTSGDPYQYTMVVNPPWNATGSVSKRTYTVTVPVTGDITMKDKNTGTSIAKTGVSPNTYFPMTLGTPSVTGTVVSGSPEAGVRDSWVVPINAVTGEWLWQQGQHSKANGAFGLGVSDGNYKIQAEVPWGVTGLTRSAQCAVTVTGGAITSAGTSCAATGGVIKLTLREPNLKMTLVQNGVAVPYAHVGIGIGSWNTGSQADAQGRVSLFVDRAAIMAANPGLTSLTDIRVWIDPPYGNSNMVRWECNSGDAKPVCSTMADFNPAAEYTPVDLGSISVLGPNTKFKIVLPNASAAPAGSWVSLLSFVPTVSCCNWIGGGNTDASGFVSFNVETATVASNVRYKVEVNPRWEDRATYSQKVYDNNGAGYTIDELNALNRTFAIGAPNVVLTVRGADISNTANKWGHVNIFEVDTSTNQPTNWVGGYGLDTLGKVALILAPNKRYRIAAFPGGGIAGTRTWCYVDTSNASESTTVLSVVTGMCGGTTTVGANNALTITLNAGNVVGTVKTSGVAVEGAIVYANVVGASNQDNAVTTTTNALGKFGLLLDPAKGQWQISIFPINKPGTAALRNKILDAITAPSLSSSNDLGDITLVP